MATRYSGDVTIRVGCPESGGYQVRITRGKDHAWSQNIQPPATGFGAGVAYDSPAAIDAVARAALAFAEDLGADISPEIETATLTARDTGYTCTFVQYAVRRTKRG